jgi:hypothetical protein
MTYSLTGLPLLSSTVRSHRHMPGGTAGMEAEVGNLGVKGAGSKAAKKGEARKEVVRSPIYSTPLL